MRAKGIGGAARFFTELADKQVSLHRWIDRIGDVFHRFLVVCNILRTFCNKPCLYLKAWFRYNIGNK